MTTRYSDTRPIDASFHHGNHRQLLANVPVDQAPRARVDALIVPTARPLNWLREAIALAARLKCGLVAMCSKAVKAADVVALGDYKGVSVVAIDVEAGVGYGLPPLSTTQRVERTMFRRSSDTSTKRNMALLLARVAGWERVLFLDDDIFAIEPATVHAAMGLLGQFDVVGMHNAGCPDNSVVCHAYRRLGGEQAQFIGAGALAVAPGMSQSFFPNTYNQDWFFILGCGQPTRAAVTGLMRQKEYDPFADADRARREELGDCLAEGLYWLLDHRLPIENADIEHWRDFLSRRRYFIEHLITEVTKSQWSNALVSRTRAALNVALNTCANVSPQLCAQYVRCWRHDLEAWRAFVERHPVGLGVEAALAHLKWRGVVQSVHPWPSADVGGDHEDRLTYPDGQPDPATGPEPFGAPGGSTHPSQHTPAPAGVAGSS